MYEQRIKELKKIKAAKEQEVERIQSQISQLQRQLRITIDEHNKAAWILEEYQNMSKSGENNQDDIAFPDHGITEESAGRNNE